MNGRQNSSKESEIVYRTLMNNIEEKRPAAICTRFRVPEGSVKGDLIRSVTNAEPSVNSRGRFVTAASLSKTDDLYIFTEPVLPQERLIIFGGGHIAVPVCSLGASCGFAVTVVDDRPSFAVKERFPDADELICDTFENAIERLSVGPYDYVVIVTRGHIHDAECLRRITLGKQPAYVGMIGSRKRVQAQLELLKKEGLSPERLSKVCTPIGLSIGAVTPAEIAVSIMAEVISYRRLPSLAQEGHYICESDLELSVIRYLADNADPKVILTIIESKGSAPRREGAKMAVDSCGNITGSIGGGYAEAAALKEAEKLIGTGRYKIMDFDLSNDVAAADGMACGGSLKVLIEDGTP